MHLYSVPVIPPNLRHEETIIQAANAFEYLSCVIDEVFDKINARIIKNNKRVDEFNKRIEIVNQKVDSLIGTKAVTLYSASKYPASDVHRNIPATFDFSDHKTKLCLNTNYEVKSSFDQSGNRNMKEKLQFFHVKVGGKQKDSKLYRQTLGPAPDRLTSVNAFLLFNTKDYCYDKKDDDINHSSDSKQIKTRSNEHVKLSEKRIEDAPSSIANRKTTKKFMDELFYSPKLNDAPQIDVPLVLPDLPGVADDIMFTSEEDYKIIMPEPKESTVREIAVPVENLVVRKVEETVTSKPVIPIEIKAAPSTSVDAAPPPPPPPPMPIAESNLDAPDTPTKNVAKTAPADMGNAHMNLMAAIRATGGKERAKLRAAASSKEEDIPKPKPGGDLMADLHNKLLMRRKGISGAKDNNPTSNQGGSMIEKLSALIPAISKQNKDSNSESSDEDWE